MMHLYAACMASVKSSPGGVNVNVESVGVEGKGRVNSEALLRYKIKGQVQVQGQQAMTSLDKIFVEMFSLKVIRSRYKRHH